MEISKEFIKLIMDCELLRRCGEKDDFGFDVEYVNSETKAKKMINEDVYRGDGLILYAYCKNNPVVYYDPSGYKKQHKPQCKEGTSAEERGTGEGLIGNNWSFSPEKDVDFRGTDKTYKDAIEEAFKRTGIPKENFEVSQWGKDSYGKSIPVEWMPKPGVEGAGGATVNMDIPEWNNIKPDGTLGEGPLQPHIGYQNSGKGKDRVRGHIFVDNVPATRR